MNAALLKYLQSLGPDALQFMKGAGGAAKEVGKVGLDQGAKLAGDFPKTAAAAGGGGLAALLAQLGGEEEPEAAYGGY